MDLVHLDDDLWSARAAGCLWPKRYANRRKGKLLQAREFDDGTLRAARSNRP